MLVYRVNSWFLIWFNGSNFFLLQFLCVPGVIAKVPGHQPIEELLLILSSQLFLYHIYYGQIDYQAA